jgi:putative component of membrane protein insertase Oxa1/YidC/SpoIIIJ protein YidD
VSDFIDPDHTACLCDVGSPDYIAAIAIGPDCDQRLILAMRDAIGDPDVRYDPTCSDVGHEQLGALPIEIVRRITISGRVNRCGRRTKSGTPCQTPVTRAGDACGWHRTEART